MSWFNSFALSHAAMAPFLFLVCVPLLLHLFARARPPQYSFSSIEFVQRIVRQSIRLKKPQSWLVLLIRTLFFTAIIGAFLGPVYFGKGRLAGYFQRKHVVVLVDASASMACMEGAQTRFAIACAKASEVLSGLSASDAANIIWMRTPNRAEFQHLGSNIPYLQTVLRKASVSTEAAELRGAMTMAVEMLKETDVAREIYIISDFQKSAWTGLDAAVPEGIRVIQIKTAAEETQNQSLSQLYARPSRPLIGEEVSVFCEIENFSPEALLKTVYFRAGEARQQQEVRLPPWGKASLVFRCKFSKDGENVVSVSLNEDLFPFDNERWTVVQVRENLRVGLFSEEPLTAEYWRRALNAVGWAKIQTITRENLREKMDFDLVLLSGWDGAESESVREFLRSGSAVLWYPGPRVSPSHLRQLAYEGNQEPLEKTFEWEKSKKPFRLKISQPENPVFEIFAKGIHGDPTRGAVWARWNISPSADLEAILSYEDGVPALSIVQNAGRLLVWNIPLQAEASNWASQAEFLPFLSELLLHYRAGDLRKSVDHLPGEVLLLSLDREGLSKDVSLRFGDDWLEVQRLQQGNQVSFASSPVRNVGNYEWYFHSKLVAHHVVNFPRIESDLRTIPLKTLNGSNAFAIESGYFVPNLREGTSLWPWLLAAGILLILAENAVLLREAKS